jgi:hypothetical protein
VLRIGFHGCTAVALAALAAPAHAQDLPPILEPPAADAPPAEVERPEAPSPNAPTALAPGPDVYTPADFVQYAPRTAFDMLQQVPGFNIQESFGQGRGLGEATGNVLLNGERISSKSDSVTQRLTRVPAANVARIEFVDGATLDIPGLTGRVANVITSRTSDDSGQFEWSPQLATDYATLRWTAFRASVTGKRGNTGYTVAVDNSPFHGGTGGPNHVIDRGVFEERFSRTQSEMYNPRVSMQLRLDGPGNSIGNFSALYQKSWLDGLEEEYVVAPPGAPPWREDIANENDGFNYEIGGDYEFGLGPGRLKLIALESYRQSAFATQAVTDRGSTAPRTGTRFTQRSQSGERIARAEYKWKLFGGDWQLSAEAAFNRLNNRAGLAFLTPGGRFLAIPFPAGTGGVTEDRYESILSFGRPLSSSLSLQMSVGGEYSTIAQTGSNALSRTFVRPKGSLSLAWAARDDLDVSLKLTRRVGQLNFNDFLADVNLSNNNVNAGNNELRPDQAWELELEAARNLGAWGSITLSAFHNRITDYVTIVPLPGGGESVGNIDQAEETGVSLTATIRLDPVGFRGAKFDIDAQVRESRLNDPVTDEVRAFDRSQPRNFNIQFRHDVPGTDLAWGTGFRSTDFNPYYRLHEVGVDYNLRDAFGIFIEHKDVFGLTVIARLNNILEENAALERTVYAGPRGSGAPVLFEENRQREIGHIVNFTVRGSF